MKSDYGAFIPICRAQTQFETRLQLPRGQPEIKAENGGISRWLKVDLPVHTFVRVSPPKGLGSSCAL